MNYVVIILLVIVGFNVPSYGYVDPGAGQLIWQALLAGFFGGFFVLKRFLTFPVLKRSKQRTDNE